MWPFTQLEGVQGKNFGSSFIVNKKHCSTNSNGNLFQSVRIYRSDCLGISYCICMETANYCTVMQLEATFRGILARLHVIRNKHTIAQLHNCSTTREGLIVDLQWTYSLLFENTCWRHRVCDAGCLVCSYRNKLIEKLINWFIWLITSVVVYYNVASLQDRL